jgi:D-aminoacyl-tRNA deacylase
MILVVASLMDPASLNISRRIMEDYDFRKLDERFQGSPVFEAEVEGKAVRLVTLSGELIFSQSLAGWFSGFELVVFVSRHSSVSGTPTLSVHTSGNLGKAELGGVSKRVSVSPAGGMRDVLVALARFKDEARVDYEVSYECTHHGPCLDVASMFVELGSSAEQWGDLEAADVVARAAMEAVSRFGDFHDKAVVGIGGPHYSEKFTRLALEEGFAFGHMVPKYAVSVLDLEVLRQCVERTLEKVERVVLDWKGIRGADKPRLVELLTESGFASVKV